MILLILFISLLYLHVLKFRKKYGTFTKEKVVVLKAIFVLCIILHHISLIVYGIFLSQFYIWGRIGVSMFFFISGFGLMKSLFINEENYVKTFISHRIIDRLLMPFILVVILYTFLNLGNLSLCKYIRCLFFIDGETLLPYSWFVYITLVLYLIFYINAKILSNRSFVLRMIVCSIGLICCTKMLGYGLWVYVSVFAFPLGIIYSKYENYIIESFNKVGFVANFYYFLIPSLLIFYMLVFKATNDLINILSTIFVVGMIILLCCKVDIESYSQNPIVKFISKISYEMYLCHGMVMHILRGKVFNVDSNSFYIINTLLITILFSYFIKKIEQFYFKYR